MQLCERFGYDAARVERQLRLVGLTSEDHALVEGLGRDVLDRHAQRIVACFYAQLKGDPRFWEVISRGFSLPHLYRAQIAALRSLGRDFDTLGYFEIRLRIGVAHARAKVPLDLFLGAYRILTQEVLDRIPIGVARSAEYRSLVLKLMMLDMSIVAATYHAEDMAELQRMLERSQTDADHQRERARRDSLTALYNRDYVFEVLETSIEAATLSGKPLALAMLDVDHFKPINDFHGHAVGDEVLRLVVARMRTATRDDDTLGRYGGDEFALVLPNVGPSTALEIVERLRSRVEGEPFHVAGQTLRLTVSAGLAFWEEGLASSTLLQRADDTLYRAKREGRNRVCHHPLPPPNRTPTLAMSFDPEVSKAG